MTRGTGEPIESGHPMETALKLLQQLLWCKAQVQVMRQNVELAQDKAHKLLARLEDEGVHPIRKTAVADGFRAAGSDIDGIEVSIETALARILGELRRTTTEGSG